jgi:hypothetical protein
MANKIEIKGLSELIKAFDGLPRDVAPSVVRNIARKPANRIVSMIRKLFPFKKTGATKRSFGIKKVKNRLQMFLEVGIKGRSLAPIFIMGAKDRRRKSGAETGSIPSIGNIVEEGAEKAIGVSKELEIDLSKHIEKSLRKHLRR